MNGTDMYAHLSAVPGMRHQHMPYNQLVAGFAPLPTRVHVHGHSLCLVNHAHDVVCVCVCVRDV